MAAAGALQTPAVVGAQDQGRSTGTGSPRHVHRGKVATVAQATGPLSSFVKGAICNSDTKRLKMGTTISKNCKQQSWRPGSPSNRHMTHSYNR